MLNNIQFPYASLTGITANMETPKHYFDQIVGYIPNILDTINTWIHEPLVEKLAWIVLISWFIFRLLNRE